MDNADPYPVTNIIIYLYNNRGFYQYSLKINVDFTKRLGAGC
jgi:hypothetical protein